MASGLGIIAIRGRRDRHGGESARLHARRRELTAEAERLTAERTRMTAEVAAAEVAHDAANGQLVEATATRATAEQALLAADRVAADLDRQSAAAREDLARLATELASLERARAGGAVSRPTTRATSRVEALSIAATEALRERDEAAAARDAARDAWQAARGAAEAAEARSVGRRRDRVAAEARIAQLEIALPDHERAIAEVQAIRDDIEGVVTAASAADAAAGEAQRTADTERDGAARSSSSWNGRPAHAGASSASSSAPPIRGHRRLAGRGWADGPRPRA